MPYYPKNKIQTNLFSNGGDMVKASDLGPYTGPYYKLSSGKMFIGSTPNSRRYPEEIINLNDIVVGEDNVITNKLSTSSTLSTVTPNQTLVFDYVGALEEKPSSKLVPTPFYPKPTLQDYKRGYFTRYFTKQINNYSFIEIDKSTYENLSNNNSKYLWELYYITEIPWQISGDASKVYSTNEKVVNIQENKQFKGLSTFLRKNYLKFYLDKDKVGALKNK